MIWKYLPIFWKLFSHKDSRQQNLSRLQHTISTEVKSTDSRKIPNGFFKANLYPCVTALTDVLVLFLKIIANHNIWKRVSCALQDMNWSYIFRYQLFRWNLHVTNSFQVCFFLPILNTYGFVQVRYKKKIYPGFRWSSECMNIHYLMDWVWSLIGSWPLNCMNIHGHYMYPFLLIHLQPITDCEYLHQWQSASVWSRHVWQLHHLLISAYHRVNYCCGHSCWCSGACGDIGDIYGAMAISGMCFFKSVCSSRTDVGPNYNSVSKWLYNAYILL